MALSWRVQRNAESVAAQTTRREMEAATNRNTRTEHVDHGLSPQGCLNQIQRRNGTFVTVDHCGGVSLWRVASGGRMGTVFGEDATEVAPPATDCTQNCQAQNRVRGQSVVLGFPFPVPDTSRLKPRFPAGFQP
jgi:hypothetical protein